tara:strand:- start:112 stop:762 length:651 start_codon:yes stop_codon:yes gene_type:complete
MLGTKISELLRFRPSEDVSYGRQIADELAEHLCLEVVECLGEGLQGQAFLMNSGQVLKITNDESEYFVCTSLINKSVKHIYKIYSTYRLRVNGGDLFGILEERLDTSEVEFLEEFERVTDFFNFCRKFINGNTHYSPSDFSELRSEADSIICSYPRYIFFVNQFIEMTIASLSVGVTSSDMHANNIGRKGDHLVLFDLGFSNTAFKEEGFTLSMSI